MASIADYYTEIGKQPDNYSDFLVNFNAHPNQKDLMRNVNIDAVRRSVRNLIMTNKYDRLMNGDIGANIRRILFESFSPAIVSEIQNSIHYTLKKYEPRAILYNNSVVVDASTDLNYINVKVTFGIANIIDPVSVELNLKRLR